MLAIFAGQPQHNHGFLWVTSLDVDSIPRLMDKENIACYNALFRCVMPLLSLSMLCRSLTADRHTNALGRSASALSCWGC
jgi:hypothetical protein